VDRWLRAPQAQGRFTQGSDAAAEAGRKGGHARQGQGQSQGNAPSRRGDEEAGVEQEGGGGKTGDASRSLSKDEAGNTTAF